VGGALDQAGTGVEEAVGLPFQRDAAVRTAVEIHVDLTRTPYRQHFAPLDVETATVVVGQFGVTAQKFHVSLDADIECLPVGVISQLTVR